MLEIRIFDIQAVIRNMDIFVFICLLVHMDTLETQEPCYHVVFMFRCVFHVGLTAKNFIDLEIFKKNNEPGLFFCECQNRSTGSSTGRLVLCIFVFF